MNKLQIKRDIELIEQTKEDKVMEAMRKGGIGADSEIFSYLERKEARLKERLI